MKQILLLITVIHLCISVSFAWNPMEPASRTLVVLVHGINPPDNGLFQTPQEKISLDAQPDNYECSDESGAAHIFRSFGLWPFLERDSVIGLMHNIYARAFVNPENSPADLANELGDRNWVPGINPTCSGFRLIKKIDDKGERVVREIDIVSEFQLDLKNVFEMATIRWFEGMVLESKVSKPQGDPEVISWIKQFQVNHHTDPVLADFRNAQHHQLIPSRFIIIPHSMGGLDIREYIFSTKYAGDVDKVITLDTPHGGSYATQAIKLVLDDNLINKELEKSSKKLALGNLLLLTSSESITNKIGKALIDNALPDLFTTLATKALLAKTLADGYGLDGAAVDYFADFEMDALNAKTQMATSFDFPSHRLFHHEGMVSMGDPFALPTNGGLGILGPFSELIAGKGGRCHLHKYHIPQ